MPYDVFISYASHDIAFAEEVSKYLNAEGFKVWFDKDRLVPGFNWHHLIEQGCENSRVILPILTPRWKLSDWTKYETYGAEAVVPLLFEGTWTEVATPPLERFQAEILDMNKPGGPDWARLFSDIRRVRDKPLPEKTAHITHIHYRANDHFIGRDKDIIHIHEELHSNPRTALTQGRVRAIAAMGGVGKTTLARQYAEKFWRCYPQMFWVDARKGLNLEFAEIHDFLFPDRKNIGLDSEDKAKQALNELQKADIRLLIIDNADDEQSIIEWIPKTGGCHTLITSRFSGFSAAVKTLYLFVLEKEFAVEFLQDRSGRVAHDRELTCCEELADRLGYLPLALEQAAAYMEQQGASFSFMNYLDLYEEATTDLLAEKVLGSTEYPDSVITTMKSSIAKLTSSARAILRIISLMATTPIPLHIFANRMDLVLQLAHTLTPSIEAKAPSNANFWIRNEVGHLKAYSLVTVDGQTLLLHPLLQTVEFLTQSDIERSNAWTAAVQLLISSSPTPCWKEDCRVQWNLDVDRSWDVLTPHVERLHKLEKELTNITSIHNFHLLTINAYASKNAFDAAIPVCSELCRQVAAVSDESDPILLEARDSLSCLLKQSGHYQEALNSFQSLYELRVKVQGKEHQDTLRTHHNIACLRKIVGDLAGAESIMRDVLNQRRRILGEDHYDTITSEHDLGWVLMENDSDVDEAEHLLRRAKEHWLQTLGIASPDTRAATTNLASLLRKKGDFAQAETIQRELLEGTQVILGPGHLECFCLMHNLALFVYNNGRPKDALDLISKVVEGYKRYLPPDHRDMLTAMQDMGTVLGALGRYNEAEPLLREALSGYERTQEPDTIDTLRTVNNLAYLLQCAGRLNEAKPFYKRYLEAKISKPDTKPIELRQAAGSCFNVKDYDFAEHLLNRVLDLHFEIPGTHCHLARIYLLLDRDKDAEEHIDQAWNHRDEAPAYVILRILLFRILFAMIDGTDPALYLSRLKTALSTDGAHMDWTMEPVLEKLRQSLSPDTHAFLTALVTALSSKENLPALDAFPAWRAAKPEPLE